MYDFALTICAGDEGIYERRWIDEYECIHVSDEIFERVLPEYEGFKTYFPEINKWSSVIDWTGITIIPMESMKRFLAITVASREKDYWNLYELEGLITLVEQGIRENRSLIIFGI